MELIAHWWNETESDHLPRQEVFVRHNVAGGQYEVEHRVNGRSTLREYATATQACYVADALRAGINGWHNLTDVPV